MSRYTGKCDFCDEIDIMGLDNILASKVYLNGKEEPLCLKSYKDCVPYFTHIVSACGFTNRIGTVWLTDIPWLDICESRWNYPYEYFNDLRLKLAEEFKKNGISGVISQSRTGETIAYENLPEGYMFVERDKYKNVLAIRSEYADGEFISALRIAQALNKQES